MVTPTSQGHFHDLGPRSIHRSDLTPIDLSKFVVVTMVSNPIRYRTRYNLYRKFAKHIEESGVQLLTVEIAYGERPFEITEAENPWHIQLKCREELWHKESALNIGVSRIPIKDWKYLAWIDADVQFARADWAQETVHQLQHYDFVQLFSQALDMGPPPSLEVISTNIGVNYCYANQHTSPDIPLLVVDGKLNPKRFTAPVAPTGTTGGPYRPDVGLPNKRVYWHPGFAHACRREAFTAVGGLLDTGVLGAGDHHMSLALLGRGDEAMPVDVTPGYRATVMKWQARADRYVRRNVGYVPGTILHGWHASKAKRFYRERWQILTSNKFDPTTDLIKNSQGLWLLNDDGSDRMMNLRDQIRAYFRSRDEDSIEP